MRFDKERFKRYIDCFEFSKQTLRDDLFFALGKIKTEKKLECCGVAIAFRNPNCKECLGRNYYSDNDRFVERLVEVSILSLLLSPFRLLIILFWRAMVVLLFIISFPFAVISNIYLF